MPPRMPCVVPRQGRPRCGGLGRAGQTARGGWREGAPQTVASETRQGRPGGGTNDSPQPGARPRLQVPLLPGAASGSPRGPRRPKRWVAITRRRRGLSGSYPRAGLPEAQRSRLEVTGSIGGGRPLGVGWVGRQALGVLGGDCAATAGSLVPELLGRPTVPPKNPPRQFWPELRGPVLGRWVGVGWQAVGWKHSDDGEANRAEIFGAVCDDPRAGALPVLVDSKGVDFGRWVGPC